MNACVCRALSLVATNTQVARDMFYNGDVKEEPGAVVCRVAPSFVRFGTFQLPVSRGEKEAHLTKQVADYVIKHHFSDLEGQEGKYLKLLQRVVDTTVELVVKWQLVGFVHGALCSPRMFCRTAPLPP
jgi:serine/tyrosine/threonine adenylyltransferase